MATTFDLQKVGFNDIGGRRYANSYCDKCLMSLYHCTNCSHSDSATCLVACYDCKEIGLTVRGVRVDPKKRLKVYDGYVLPYDTTEWTIGPESNVGYHHVPVTPKETEEMATPFKAYEGVAFNSETGEILVDSFTVLSRSNENAKLKVAAELPEETDIDDENVVVQVRPFS